MLAIFLILNSETIDSNIKNCDFENIFNECIKHMEDHSSVSQHLPNDQ